MQAGTTSRLRPGPRGGSGPVPSFSLKLFIGGQVSINVPSRSKEAKMINDHKSKLDAGGRDLTSPAIMPGKTELQDGP